MKNLSIQEMGSVEGGGLFTSLVGTVEGILNPLATQLDTLLASLPLPALPGLPGLGSIGSLPVVGGLLGGLGL